MVERDQQERHRDSGPDDGAGAGEAPFSYLARLRLVTRALADVVDVDEMMRIVLNQALAVLPEPHGGVLGLVSDDHLEIVAAERLDPKVIAEFDPMPISDEFPLVDAVRSGEAVWIPNRAERDERYPALAGRFTETEASVSLPLSVGGRTTGVIGLSFNEPIEFTQADQLFLLTLADHCAGVLARSREPEHPRRPWREFNSLVPAESKKWARWIAFAVAIVGPVAIAAAYAQPDDPVAFRPTAPFIALVVLVAAFGGVRPALVASAVSLVAFWLVVLEPRWTFTLHEWQELAGLGLFAGACLAVTWIVHRFEDAQRQVAALNNREARDREAALQRELAARSAELTASVRYQSLVEATTAVVWRCDPDGAFVTRQRSWQEFTGQTWEAQRGQGWFDALHTDDRDRVRALSDAARAHGEPYEARARIWNENAGRHCWCVIRAVPIRDERGRVVEWIGTLTDVHGQTVAQEALEAVTARLDAMMRTAPVGFAFVDPDLSFVLVNDRLAEVHGVPVEEHIGRPVSAVVGDLGDVHESRLRRVLETGDAELDVELTGAGRDWLVNYYPVSAAGDEVLGIGMTMIEVTERNRLLSAEHQARETAERLARRVRQVQEVSDVALGRLPLEDLLDSLVHRLHSVLGVDTVRILFADEGATMLTGGAALGFDPEPELSTEVPVGKGLAGLVAASRQPVVLNDVADFPFHSKELAARGLASVAGVPLLTEDRLVGVLHVGSLTPREFSSEEVELLTLAGERIATAIERSRYFEAERAARERSEFLTAVSEALVDANERDEIMRRVTTLAVPRLGDWCSMHVLGEDGAEPFVEVAHVDPAKVAWARALQEQYPFDPGAPTGVAAVLRTGEVEFYPRITADLVAEVLEDDVESRALLEELQLSSVIVVPLRTASGVIGALQLVAAESGRNYSADDLVLAQDVAGRVSVALENAGLFRRQREISETLQRSLLPTSIPRVPGIEVAARYWPAGVGSEVGGDFYDVLALDERTWGVLIGDVSGKGTTAAALTGLARHTLRRQPGTNGVRAPY